jgi:AcrR family transcriptional regulator
MTKEPVKAKDRILMAALHLFSQRGYAAVGVREIAQRANVNISMISYYFGGKIGILKSLIDRFHDQYVVSIEQALDDSIPPEDCVRAIIHNLLDFVRENTDLSMLFFHTLPLDIPEIAEHKEKRVLDLLKKISGLARNMGLNPDDKMLFLFLGPTILNMILTHFRLRPLQKQIFKLEFNNDFYARFESIASTFVLYGLTGLAERKP